METNLRKSRFTIETFPGEIFEGYTSDEEWNGWAAPCFTFEESQKIAEAHRRSLNINTRYDNADDKFTFEFLDGTEEYQAVMIEDKKVYPLGNSVWIWEEV